MAKKPNYYFFNLHLKHSDVILTMDINSPGFYKYKECLDFCELNGDAYIIYYLREGIRMIKKRVRKPKKSKNIKQTKYITPTERAERLMLVHKRRDESQLFTRNDIKRLADLNFKLFKDK